MNRIYLDNNATTAADPEVIEVMVGCLRDVSGNPSSLHAFGQEARRVMDRARASAARLVNADPDEIIFTGSGTEANNIAILGAAAASRRRGPQVVATSIEHQSVLGPCRNIVKAGGSASFIGVDGEGLVDPDAVSAAMVPETALVSVMLANNDTGAILPVSEAALRAHERSVPFHTDAVQAVGKIPVDVKALGVDMLSFSGHKIHGPKGVGALFVRRGTRLAPLTFGGHQERGLRPGTENVAAIAGFGRACELAASRLGTDAARIGPLRDQFEKTVLESVSGASVNSGCATRLPNTSNLSFDGVDGDLLVISLDLLGLAASTGAACSAADGEPSHVLVAMGRTPLQARHSIRLSFGRDNTHEEAARAVELVIKAVSEIRARRR